MKEHFLLDPNITYLNFASFGACPKIIFNDYQKWQLELETEPVQFMTNKSLVYLQQSRNALAQYINCNEDDVVYVTNPSYAVNIIAKGLNLKANDEILTTNLEYGACEKAWDYYCAKAHAKLVRQTISLPITSKEKLIEEFFKGITSNTKAIFISHITSSTALILPAKEICEIAKTKGLITIVDGAHVPGHIPLNLSELKADFYTGACHKWMMTAKGSSFLYIKKEFQPVDPLMVSWGYQSAAPSHSTFLDYHQMQGTRDISAFLTIPKAIEFMTEHRWLEKSKACKEMVINNAPRFFELLNAEPLSPLTTEFIGQMISFSIKTSSPEKLQKHLFETYKIEIPVMRHNSYAFLRYSINAFNTQADLDSLYSALHEIIHTTNLLNV
jgi:isopenicillin-N epimerase